MALHKHVEFVELLDVLLDFGHLLLTVLLAALQTDRIDLADVRDALVHFVDFLPLPFEGIPQLSDFLLAHAVLVLGNVVLQILDHAIFVLDVVLHLLKVVRNLPIVLLLNPIGLALGRLRHRQYVFDCVRYDEVLVGAQPEHRLVSGFRHGIFFVTAIVAVLANYIETVCTRWEAVVAHCACGFSSEVLWGRLALT